MTVYLDCNATTSVDPRVRDEVVRFLDVEYGNAGSTTHAFGARAKHAVEQAREQVARVVNARRHEVIFTSGATESNNLAILGLAAHGERTGRRHVVSTAIEHKAVLEPLAELIPRGFDVTLVPPTAGGYVEAQAVLDAVRDETLLVSVMQANNETGVRQPIEAVAAGLEGRDVFLHVDAAQGFGKEIEPLALPRIDLVSISGHKLFAPKGIGALIARRREFELPPLAPLMFGGGQEFGLRPGTLPVHLIVGLGLAAELGLAEHQQRAKRCLAIRDELLAALAPLAPIIHGELQRTMPHVVNLSLPGVDADLAMEALEDSLAVSNGSACTSVCDTGSHVLRAMGLSETSIDGAMRFSWCHTTTLPPLEDVVRKLKRLAIS